MPKSQPWKAFWPPQEGAAQTDMTPAQMNLQRSYGTHASNTKGRIFEIDTKAQPWKAFWPPKEAGAQTEMTSEQMNLQRSYGTHASNTKGRIFAIDNKPKCEFKQRNDQLVRTNMLPW